MLLVLLLLVLLPIKSWSYPGGPSSVITAIRTNYVTVNGGSGVTTSAWTTIVPSISKPVTKMHIFDSSGQTMMLGDFESTCTSLIQPAMIIEPGGPGDAPMSTSQGDCLQLKAITGTANVGENDVTFYY